MERYGLKPVCFTASGDFGMKPVFRDYPVMTFEEAERKFTDFVVLVCFGSDKTDVLERINSIADKYETFVPDVPVVGRGIYTPEYVEENREKLDKVRNLLADEKSREVFEGWLEYRLGGNPAVLDLITTSREDMLSLLKLNDNEFFIDAGAFKGDTVDEFLSLVNKKFMKIIAIEPDVKNYTLLRRKYYAYPAGTFIPVNAAAWGTNEMVKFTVKSGRGGLVLDESEESEKFAKTGRNRHIDINGVTIDSLCNLDRGDKPTFIKIDVEGAEAQVLKGSKTVIAKSRPKMIVSLYHKCEDMFELPLLIHSFYSRYKFYLRKTRCLPGWEFQFIVV
jgi:FkbM family methyltransferase